MVGSSSRLLCKYDILQEHEHEHTLYLSPSFAITVDSYQQMDGARGL